MYQVKSVSIDGMRKVKSTTYDFGLTSYFHGPNGSGKSTVINAIQLALLGYIPGQPKSNLAIMSNANSSIMSVSVTLWDEKHKNEISITRTYHKKGSGVQCSVEVTPEDVQVDEIIGNLSLPVFDWAEFEALSSNKAKDWFIDFIASDNMTVNWSKELNQSLPTCAVLNEAIVDEYSKQFSKLQGNSAIDIISDANKTIKSDISYCKAALAEKQGTLNELMYSCSNAYDLDELDQLISKHKAELEEQNNIYNGAKQQYDSMYETFAEQQKQIMEANVVKSHMLSKDEQSTLESAANDASVQMKQLDKTICELQLQLNNTENDEHEAYMRYSDVSSSAKTYEQVSNSSCTCPYTDTDCDDIKSKRDDFASKAKQYKEEADKWSKMLKSIEQHKVKLNSQLNESRNRLLEYKNKLAMVADKLKKSNEVADKLSNMPFPCDKDLISKESILEARKSVDTAAYKKDNLTAILFEEQSQQKQLKTLNSISKSKAMLEEKIEILKAWDKLTGPNGLPSTLSEHAFKDLSNDLDKYLEKMFKDGSKCRFNIAQKANSFSFGVQRKGSYIPYNSLSTGEKTMYAFSLMLYILDKSNCPVKTLLIDDMLDHLDSQKLEDVLETAYKNFHVQIVMAGVNPCTLKCVQTVEL